MTLLSREEGRVGGGMTASYEQRRQKTPQTKNNESNANWLRAFSMLRSYRLSVLPRLLFASSARVQHFASRRNGEQKHSWIVEKRWKKYKWESFETTNNKSQ